MYRRIQSILDLNAHANFMGNKCMYLYEKRTALITMRK